MTERRDSSFPAAKPTEEIVRAYIPTREDIEGWDPHEYGAYLGMVLACDGDKAKAWEMRSNNEGFVQRLFAEGEKFLDPDGASSQSFEPISAKLPFALAADKKKRADYSEPQKRLFQDVWMVATGRIAPFFEEYVRGISEEFPMDNVEDIYKEALHLVDATARNAFNRGFCDSEFTPAVFTLPLHHKDAKLQRLYTQIATLTDRIFYFVGHAMRRRSDSIVEDIWRFGESITEEEDVWLRKNWAWLNLLLSEIIGAVQPIMPERRLQLGETSIEVSDRGCIWHGVETDFDRAKMDDAFEVGYRLKRADGGV